MSKLVIPEKVLDQHSVVLGKTGAGKSSTLRHIVEHLLSLKKRVCVIDPKGDWWGLKVSADGNGAGYPVIAFGDFKDEQASDVPINAQSGRHVAELITSGNRPCVIGFRGWMTSHMVQFWIDFAAGIFNANSGELYLVGDEFHNFAPKGKIMDPQAGKCLHWSNRLMSEGRGLGIVCLIASQRPQKVHNDTLTSCETLIAMRVIHAADRKSVEDWIKGAGDEKQGKLVLYGDKDEKVPGLAQMPRGSAWVWSPEIDYGPEIVEFPMFETFDSFAPPQLQKKISKRSWSDVNLDEVKEKLAAVIAEHEANDPKALRKQVADLQRELAHARSVVKIEKGEIREVPVLKDGQLTRVDKILDRAEKLFARHSEDLLMLRTCAASELEPVREALIKIGDGGAQSPLKDLNVGDGAIPRVGAPWRASGTREQPSRLSRNEGNVTTAGKAQPPATGVQNTSRADALPPRRQRILDALLFFESLGCADAAREWVAFFCDTSPNSSTYEKDCGAMRTAGLIAYPTAGRLQLTDVGSAAAQPTPAITLGDFHAKVERLLPPRRQKIARALIEVHPEPLSRAELAARCATSPDSSTFEKDLGGMRTAGLLEYPQQGYAKASDLLFPPLPS